MSEKGRTENLPIKAWPLRLYSYVVDPFVVSYGRELDASVSKPLLEFRRAAGRRETNLTVVTKDTEKTEPGVRFIPLWKWLLDGEKHDRS